MNAETYEQRLAREQGERAMRAQANHAAARAIAQALGATIESNDEREMHVLTLEGRTFWLHFDRWNKKGRIEIAGKWPHERRPDGSSQMVSPRDVGYGYDWKSTITVAADRPVKAIVGAIRSRFLPSFIEAFDKCAERIAINEERGNDCLQAARELGAKFRAKVEPDGQGAKLWIAGQHVSVHAADSVYFSRGFSCNVDQAKRILAILSERE
jgi:hypothetical protein